MRQINVLAVSLASVVCLFGCGGGATANVSSGPMPEGGEFTGVYHSPQYGEMNLLQNGSSVIGEYKTEMRTGRIQGEAEGDLLRFEWTEQKAMISNRAQETRGHGYWKYMVDKGNGDHVLKGEWGMGDSETGGGEWNAYKLKNKQPVLSGGSGSSGGEKTDDSSNESNDSSSGDQKSDEDLF
jgi:hypothetical protein